VHCQPLTLTSAQGLALQCAAPDARHRCAPMHPHTCCTTHMPHPGAKPQPFHPLTGHSAWLSSVKRSMPSKLTGGMGSPLHGDQGSIAVAVAMHGEGWRAERAGRMGGC